jgi:hypothetical protein
MSENLIKFVSGQPKAIPIQCKVFGGLAAIYNSTDILTGSIRQTRQSADLFSMPMDWYTANSTQNGYGQGQIQATLTIANAVLLVPGISYTLLAWRALAGSPSNPELIARVPLKIEPIPV